MSNERKQSTSEGKSKTKADGVVKKKTGKTATSNTVKATKKKNEEAVSKVGSKEVQKTKSPAKTKSKKDNYTRYREEIIRIVSDSSVCYSCRVRNICKDICTKRNIDTSVTSAPCFEAWNIWCEKIEETT